MEQKFHPYETKYIYLEFLIQIVRSLFADHVAQCLFNHSPLLEKVVYRLVLEVVHRALAEE